MADSTKRLNSAAQLVYARKYGNKTVHLCNTHIPSNRLIRITTSQIFVVNLKITLQLLRCFGHAIRQLILHFDEITCCRNDEKQMHSDRQLFTYINEYCAEHLQTFIIHFPPNGYTRRYPVDFMEYFKRPFVNVSAFGHSDHNFTEQNKLIEIFPKLTKILSCHGKNASFYEMNEMHFPYLQNLVIRENICMHADSVLENEMIIGFLRSNPQLTDLEIKAPSSSSALNTNLLRDAVEYLQNVENLKLNLQPATTFIKGNDNVIHMKSVKSFAINFESLKELPNHFLPFSFEQLTRFDVTYPIPNFRSSFQEEFFNFIEVHPTITHLGLHNCLYLGVDWPRLAISLPLLVDMNLPDSSFLSDEAIEFISKFPTVKTFQFQLGDSRSKLEYFYQRLDTWEVTYDSIENWVKLNRRIWFRMIMMKGIIESFELWILNNI